MMSWLPSIRGADFISGIRRSKNTVGPSPACLASKYDGTWSRGNRRSGATRSHAQARDKMCAVGELLRCWHLGRAGVSELHAWTLGLDILLPQIRRRSLIMPSQKALLVGSTGHCNTAGTRVAQENV